MTIGRLTDESAAYAKIRDELQQAEITLRDQREQVAALRRSLPLDTEIGDETFEEWRDGRRRPVRLSELLGDATTPVVLMHFMYGKKQTVPCPMCTMWADGYDGTVPHLSQRMTFAIFVAGDIESFAAYAAARGWRHARLVSAVGSDLKRRLGFETDEGGQWPGVSVFRRGDDGTIRHFYSQSALMGDTVGRGMDLLSPVWNFFDLTPDGRGDWFPS